jgi:excisionase family DNA binding protein
MTTERDAWTDEQLLLTAEEAARALNVGRTTLYALIKDGELHSVHIGRSCRLTRAELLRYVNRLDEPAAPPTRERRRTTPTNPAMQNGLFDLDPTPPGAA